MQIRYETNDCGDLDFLSVGAGGNYISSLPELEILRPKEDAPGKIAPFGAISFSAVCEGKLDAGTPDFVPKGETFVAETKFLRLAKRWREVGGELLLELSLENCASREVRVEELGVSVPFNNNYCRFMFDQDFLYRRRTCEHYYPCGESSFVVAEMLDGKQPLCYLLCGEGTKIEHFRKNEDSVFRGERGVLNHSYPGSLEALFIAGTALAALGERIPADAGGSFLTLPAGGCAAFSLRLGFCPDRAAFDRLRVASGQVVLRPVSGLVQPKELGFVFEALADGPVRLECPEGTLERLEKRRYRVRFATAGQKQLDAFCGTHRARMTFYATESLESLVRARAAFILDKQVYRQPGDILDGAIVPYSEGPFANCEGLVAEEGSLWGTGSYEGGICDAYFAAEKNVLFPDAAEIARLEDYVDNYLLRYLQDPETLRVNWFGYRVAETRSYNYVHVANFYYSMFRIAELHGLTRQDKWRYLDLAARTLDVMFSVSRAMDVVVGNMGIGVVFELLDTFARIGSIDRYFELKLKFMRYMENVFFDTPYASECPYDNTGYEAVMRMCIARGERKVALDLADIIRTVKGNQPLWWWNGSDIRWWDAEFDFRECCHHYTSPHNGAALLELLTETDWLEPGAELLSSAYGGLLGVLAKMRADGFASMSYGPEPESVENFGFHRCTGDFSVGGMAMLKNLTAFSLVEDGRRTDWLCEGEGETFVFPKHTVRNFCRYEAGKKVVIRTDNGFLKAVRLTETRLEVSLARPAGGPALVTVRTPRRVRGFAGAKVVEAGERLYQLTLSPEESRAQLDFAQE